MALCSSSSSSAGGLFSSGRAGSSAGSSATGTSSSSADCGAAERAVPAQTKTRKRASVKAAERRHSLASRASHWPGDDVQRNARQGRHACTSAGSLNRKIVDLVLVLKGKTDDIASFRSLGPFISRLFLLLFTDGRGNPGQVAGQVGQVPLVAGDSLQFLPRGGRQF